RAVERNIPSEISAPWGQIGQAEILGCCERDVLDAIEVPCRVFGEHQISIHQVESGIDIKQCPSSVEACACIERFRLHDEVRNRIRRNLMFVGTPDLFRAFSPSTNLSPSDSSCWASA